MISYLAPRVLAGTALYLAVALAIALATGHMPTPFEWTALAGYGACGITVLTLSL